jgi:hypothetical protein
VADLYLTFMEEERAEKRREDAARRQRYEEMNSGVIAVDRPWLDPRLFDEIVGADFGTGRMHFYKLYANQEGCVPLHLVAKTLESFGSGTVVVVERAHMATPQTQASLAQPFTADQLLDIYQRCALSGVTLKLFPHHHTRKARDWAARNFSDLVEFGKSSDINDAKGLAYYVRWNNGIALCNPPASFATCRRREYGRAVRKQSNIVLNAARARGYNGEVFPSVARLANGIASHFTTDHSFIDYKVAFSIASLVATEIDDEPVRFAYHGAAPGADFFLKKVMLFSSVHHRGGVSRSNLFWHRFRPFLARFARSLGESTKDCKRYIKFSDFRPSQEHVRRQAWKFVRSEVRVAYRLAVKLSDGLPAHEILDAEMGLAYGR